jgi:hypothetical protein
LNTAVLDKIFSGGGGGVLKVYAHMLRNRAQQNTGSPTTTSVVAVWVYKQDK